MARNKEEQVRRLINEIVEGVISEGTLSHNDGVTSYQGTGTEASNERMRLINRKSFRIGTDRYGMDRWDRAEKYNGKAIDDSTRTVYNLIADYSKRAAGLYDELQKELEKMDVDDEVRSRIRDLGMKSYELVYSLYNDGRLKRNHAGEPNPKYRGR